MPLMAWRFCGASDLYGTSPSQLQHPIYDSGFFENSCGGIVSLIHARTPAARILCGGSGFSRGLGSQSGSKAGDGQRWIRLRYSVSWRSSPCSSLMLSSIKARGSSSPLLVPAAWPRSMGFCRARGPLGLSRRSGPLWRCAAGASSAARPRAEPDVAAKGAGSAPSERRSISLRRP